jgi:hypothetical protein
VLLAYSPFLNCPDRRSLINVLGLHKKTPTGDLAAFLFTVLSASSLGDYAAGSRLFLQPNILVDWHRRVPHYYTPTPTGVQIAVILLAYRSIRLNLLRQREHAQENGASDARARLPV